MREERDYETRQFNYSSRSEFAGYDVRLASVSKIDEEIETIVELYVNLACGRRYNNPLRNLTATLQPLLNFNRKKEAKFGNAVDVVRYGTHYWPTEAAGSMFVPLLTSFFLPHIMISSSDQLPVTSSQM